MANHKPLCYYVMNDGSINKDKAIFERSGMSMQQQLKPLYIMAKVEGVWINMLMVDYGVCINMTPQSLLKKIGKYNRI